MHRLTLREAEARPSHPLDLAAAGEAIEGAREGAEDGGLRPVAAGRPAFDRRPGRTKGALVLPDGSDDEDPEIGALSHDGKLDR